MTTDERRYGEEEVAAIFEAAASPRGPGGRALAPTDTGLSLRELQAIGSEVGIAPERIAEAAAALQLRGSTPARRSYMGAPISVGRVVDLPRAPTDREWAMLVAELRQTFGAKGKESSTGEMRAWTNGNLHAYVEPTADGHRLRLGTLKGDAVVFGRMGIAGLVGGLVLFLALLVAGDVGGLEDALGSGLLFALMGLLALVMNAFRLPRWAQERDEQMEQIATRALTLLRADPAPPAIGDGS